MRKTTDSLLEKLVWPILLLALTPAVTLIGSKLQSGDWLAWITQVPSWAFWLFFGIVVLWLALGLVVRRIKHLRTRNLPPLPMAFTIPRWGYVTVGILNYRGVAWRCRIPAPPPWRQLAFETAKSERVDVETPPHCPQCDTELEEQETFFGKYRWICVRCGFVKKNDISFYYEAVRAERLAQVELEKQTSNVGKT